MTTNQQKVTFGEMRSSGVHGILVSCQNLRCSHLIEMDADCWPNSLRRSDIEDWFICTRCGNRGAKVRPKFAKARMGTG